MKRAFIMSSVRREDFLSGRAVRYQHRLPGGGGGGGGGGTHPCGCLRAGVVLRDVG